jgi:RimJ/RimL family protein N-acetyltransferase
MDFSRGFVFKIRSAMTEYRQSMYCLCRLLPVDWRSYKSIRLEALATDPGVYGSNLIKESAFPDEQWLYRLGQSGSAYWALFCAEELVGLTGIYSDPDHPDEAKFIASFIRPRHRGKGLSALFYSARIDWAVEKGLKRLLVSHRAGNDPSRAAIIRAGFKYTHSESQRWPDGRDAEHMFYTLEL